MKLKIYVTSYPYHKISADILQLCYAWHGRIQFHKLLRLHVLLCGISYPKPISSVSQHSNQVHNSPTKGCLSQPSLPYRRYDYSILSIFLLIIAIFFNENNITAQLKSSHATKLTLRDYFASLNKVKLEMSLKTFDNYSGLNTFRLFSCLSSQQQPYSTFLREIHFFKQLWF